MHRLDGPDALGVALLERGELLLRLRAQLPAVLAEGLELVDELVDHLPQPEVGELHVDVAVEDDVEQVGVVVPALQRCSSVGVTLP